MTSPDTLVDHLNPFLQRRRVEQLRNMQRRQQDTITSHPHPHPATSSSSARPAPIQLYLPKKILHRNVPPNSIPALRQGERFREMQSGERSHKIESFLFQTKTAASQLTLQPRSNPAVLSYDIACTYGRQLQTAQSIPDVDRSDPMFLDHPDLMDVSDSDSEERSSGVVKIRTNCVADVCEPGRHRRHPRPKEGERERIKAKQEGKTRRNCKKKPKAGIEPARANPERVPAPLNKNAGDRVVCYPPFDPSPNFTSPEEHDFISSRRYHLVVLADGGMRCFSDMSHSPSGRASAEPTSVSLAPGLFPALHAQRTAPRGSSQTPASVSAISTISTTRRNGGPPHSARTKDPRRIRRLDAAATVAAAAPAGPVVALTLPLPTSALAPVPDPFNRTSTRTSSRTTRSRRILAWPSHAPLPGHRHSHAMPWPPPAPSPSPVRLPAPPKCQAAQAWFLLSDGHVFKERAAAGAAAAKKGLHMVQIVPSLEQARQSPDDWGEAEAALHRLGVSEVKIVTSLDAAAVWSSRRAPSSRRPIYCDPSHHYLDVSLLMYYMIATP
ncbi:hypothetical protein B0H17DRAFT_1137790 [Mycena rosella]|uniref:Uncharacterized protein n=1 Tax=Mycena rosella TaxID=1033263 RepID=A0AAD7GA94_MYCRO|nr:hypothetical protein B0H17DRAFT_1137790 [Mycena rosella]